MFCMIHPQILKMQINQKYQKLNYIRLCLCCACFYVCVRVCYPLFIIWRTYTGQMGIFFHSFPIWPGKRQRHGTRYITGRDGTNQIFFFNFFFVHRSTNIRGILLTTIGIFTTVGSIVNFSYAPFVSYYATTYLPLTLSLIYIFCLFWIPETPIFCMLQGALVFIHLINFEKKKNIFDNADCSFYKYFSYIDKTSRVSGYGSMVMPSQDKAKILRI